MAKIDWCVTAYPKSEIYGVCSECKQEVVRVAYDGYHDHRYKEARLKRQFTECPKCKKPVEDNAHLHKPKWEKQPNGDWRAKAKDGDFLVWKYGNAYKWRYRVYGGEYANYIGFALSLKEAKKACENHEKWEV
ncbi:MAG: hypothetical protein IJ308_08505 [Clostridia bacterium]|nr:hypothetical protein [Clostridia bacterium]